MNWNSVFRADFYSECSELLCPRGRVMNWRLQAWQRRSRRCCRRRRQRRHRRRRRRRLAACRRKWSELFADQQLLETWDQCLFRWWVAKRKYFKHETHPNVDFFANQKFKMRKMKFERGISKTMMTSSKFSSVRHAFNFMLLIVVITCWAVTIYVGRPKSILNWTNNPLIKTPLCKNPIYSQNPSLFYDLIQIIPPVVAVQKF